MSDSLAALFMCHNPIHEIVTIHNCWGQEFKKSFTLQKKLDSEWVTIQDDLSWAYIRLRTVTASNSNKADAPSTNSTLVLSISSNRGFTPDQIILETQVISSSKWILVADDFAEFEVDQQRYGAYFENEKTACAFTGAIAEGLQEIRSGVFAAKNNHESESTIDRHTGVIKVKKPSGGGDQGGTKKIRRKSLAQFEDVNEALASMSVTTGGVTVTETLDLGGSGGAEGRHSDLSTEGTVTSSTAQSDDLDFSLAIEKQITTVYNRDSVEGAFKRFGMSTTSCSSDLSPGTRHPIGITDPSSATTHTSTGDSSRPRSSTSSTSATATERPAESSLDSESAGSDSPSSRAPKKNSLTLSSFTSIFRKPQRSATAELEAEYQLNKESPPPPLSERKRLGCLPQRGGEGDDSDINSAHISAPESVLHMTSVHFNETLGRYEGLPEEWKVQNRVFGLPLQSLPKRVDSTATAGGGGGGGGSAGDNDAELIPTALILLKEHLIRLDAKSVVGIFRLAPDKDECNRVKDLINQGEYDYHECQDPNVLANLLKVFFRELPQNLFNSIPEREILKIASLTTMDEVVAELAPGSPLMGSPDHALIMWLLDVMALFVLNEHVNKMSAKNMAIVVSPNLYAVESENPMVALTMAQKVAEFTTKILAGRLKMKFDHDIGLK